MWLPWTYALGIAGAFVAVSLAARRSTVDRASTLAAFAREAAVVMVLYALWIVAGRLSLIDVDGAFDRARWWWDLERTFLLPNEATVQGWFLPAGWFIQLNNGYYAIVHVPAMIGTLIWMWVRHRDHYPSLRNLLALSTGASLIMQLWAVAPPRFLDDLGIVDTPALYNQSVYAALGYQTAGQLQAMPSIHVVWAVLIGYFGFRLANGWWRWLGPAHAAATVFVVVVTGNHYWVDGIVAAVILALFVPIERLVRSRFSRRRNGMSMSQDVPHSHNLTDSTPESVG